MGLAANQIGVPLRVFVYDCPDDEDRRHLGHLVNPRLVDVDGPVIRGPEGCLSLPGIEAGTPRHDHTVVTGVSVTGEPRTVTGTGFFARCLQHECDHLDGGLYVDHLSGLRRRRRCARRPRPRGPPQRRRPAAERPALPPFTVRCSEAGAVRAVLDRGQLPPEQIGQLLDQLLA